MRRSDKIFHLLFLLLFAAGFTAPALAQDDVYYDPATDAGSEYSDREESNNVTRRYDDGDDYSYDDDYAYEYSSRIRRFHRPVTVIDYYDPFFVDMYHYDPYYMPGASIYVVGNDYWSYRQWRRWQRFNMWNSWHDPYYSYGWGRPVYGGWGRPWCNPFVYNNYYYDPYWTWNGYNPYYAHGSYYRNDYYVWNNAYGNNYNNNGGYVPQTYTGVRRHGSTVNTGYARIVDDKTRPGRLAPSDKAPSTIELNRRPNPRTAQPEQPARVNDRATERSQPARRQPDVAPDRPTEKSGREVERPRETRPDQPEVEPTRPTRRQPAVETPTRDERPSRPATEETRPSRRQPATETERPRTEPSRRDNDREEARPSRRSTEERPSRSGGDDEARPSRRSYDTPSNDRPTRSRDTEARPSRSNDSAPSRSNSGGGSSDKSTKSSGSSSKRGGRG